MSFHVVPYDSVGLKYSKSSKKVDPTPNPPGRYFLGLNEQFHLFKTTLMTIDYSTTLGCSGADGCTHYPALLLVPQGNPNKVTVRMSIQYTLDDAYFIYTTYKFDSTRHFERNLRQKLKQIALQYKMHQFFDDRTSIEENFRSSCSETMAGMGAKLQLLHMEALEIPADQDAKLQSIVLQGYQMTVGVEQGNLDKKQASKTQALLEYSSSVSMDQNRIETIAGLELAKIRANHTQLSVSIERAVNEINAEQDRTHFRWSQETTNLLTKVSVNKSTADEATLLATAMVKAAAMVELAVYEQETSNLKLAVEANLTKIMEVTKQQTAAVAAAALAKLTAYDQETDMLRVALQRKEAHARAETEMEMSKIEQRILAIQAAQQAQVSRINADTAAHKDAMLERIATEKMMALDSIEKQTVAELVEAMQLNSTDVMLLKFLESFGALASSRQHVYMDINTPALFNQRGLYGGDV
jgi:hypothetical protein